MKEDENKMDELLREKFSTKSFPFDEENWEKFEEKLVVVRRNQRIRKTALIFTLGLFAGIALMLPFVHFETGSENKITSQQSETVKTTGSQTPLVNNRTNTSSVQATPSDRSAQNKNEMAEAVPATVGGNKDAAPKEKSHREEPIAVKKNSTNQYIQHVAPAAKNKTTSAKQSETPQTKQAATPAQPDAATPYSGAPASNATAQTIAGEANGISKNTTAENPPDSSRVKGFEVGKEEMPKDTVKLAPPSATAIENPSPMSPVTQKGAPTNILSIEAGANYGFGWKYGNASEGNGITPVLGIGFAHFFDTKWGIYTGLRYGLIANMNVSDKTITTATSGFGTTQTDFTVSTKWLHYLSIPLFLQYQLNEKNAVFAGATISYLINTTSDVIVRTQSDFKPVEQANKTSYGYVEGFNSLDAAISLAYRRKITGKFSILAELDYGLLDIKDDTFFSEQAFERSTGIKLLLSYDLFKH